MKPGLPLEEGKLKSRMIIVPHEQFPNESCNENGGLGWSAKVKAVKHGVATLKLVNGQWEPLYFPKSLVLTWQPVV